MAENNMKKFSFESTDLVLFIYKRLKPLIIITTVAAIISIIISLTITPKFESTAIVFPAQYTAASSILIGQNYTTDHVLRLGEEEELEQLMQILNSASVGNEIIWKYNLLDHYKIDKESKYKYTQLYKEYSSNIKFKKTQYLSARISVRDTDPQMAADIANDIVDLIDSAYHKMRKEQALASLKAVQEDYDDVTRRMQFLDDSVKKIQALGVIDFETQIERYSEAYAYAITEGRIAGANELKKKMDVLAKYGQDYMTLTDQLHHQRIRHSQARNALRYAKMDVKQATSYRFVVERAGVSEKKAYPIRWLIVSISTIVTFIFAIFLLLIIDSIKRIIKG